MRKILLVILIAFLVLIEVSFQRRIPQFAGPWKAVIERIDNVSTEFNTTGGIWLKAFFTPPRPRELQYAWGERFTGIDLTDQLQALVEGNSALLALNAVGLSEKYCNHHLKFQVEIRIAKRSNNQWKRNAFVMRFDQACSTAVFHAKWLVEMMHGKVEKCPHRATGLGHIKNKTVDPVFPQFPIFPYGHWLFSLMVLRKGQVVGLMEAECKTIPIV